MSERPDFMVVLLGDADIGLGRALGYRRRYNGIEMERRPHNGAPTDDRALAIDVNGALCERAAYLLFKNEGIHGVWHSYRPRGIRGLPDFTIGRNIVDVKGRSRGDYELCVQGDDPDHWLYILVLSHRHPEYCFLGWARGDKAKSVRMSDPAGGRPAHFFPQERLDPMSELLDILRGNGGSYG